MKPPVSVPEVTATSFHAQVTCSTLPVLVIFRADCEHGSNPLPGWLGNRRPQTHPGLKVLEVERTEAPTVAKRCGIPSGPSLVLFHAGSIAYQFCGQFTHRELDEALSRAASLGPARPAGVAGSPLQAKAPHPHGDEVQTACWGLRA